MIRCLLIIWATLATAFAGDPAAFDRANQQFHAGDFSGAAAGYEQILTAEGPDAAVLYNLGNSYQSLKQYGRAILAYERARMLTPRDPDLLANLTMARKAATAFEDAGSYPRLDALAGTLSRNEWSWLVAGSALALGWLSLLGGLVRIPPRTFAKRVVTTVAVVACLAIATGGAALVLRRGEKGRGIIVTDNTPIRLSPFKTAAVAGNAAAGHSVRLGKKSGKFQYAELAAGNLQGWVALEDAGLIAD